MMGPSGAISSLVQSRPAECRRKSVKAVGGARVPSLLETLPSCGAILDLRAARRGRPLVEWAPAARCRLAHTRSEQRFRAPLGSQKDCSPQGFGLRGSGFHALGGAGRYSSDLH